MLNSPFLQINTNANFKKKSLSFSKMLGEEIVKGKMSYLN